MKKILILLCILICTGCTASYEISIDEEYNLIESLTLTEATSVLTANGNDALYLFRYNLEISNLNYPARQYSLINKETNSEETSGTFTRQYETITLLRSSLIYQYFYGYISFDETEDAYIIEASEFTNYINQYLDDYLWNSIEFVKITLKSYYTIIDCNGDTFDKDTNTCTWEITSSTTEKPIYFEIEKVDIEKDTDTPSLDITGEKTKEAEEDETDKNNNIYAVIIIAVIVLGGASILILQKVRKTNEL